MSLLTEQDRSKAKAIIHCLFNDPQCSQSLQVDAGASIQNLLSTLTATEQQLTALREKCEELQRQLDEAPDVGRAYKDGWNSACDKMLAAIRTRSET